MRAWFFSLTTFAVLLCGGIGGWAPFCSAQDDADLPSSTLVFPTKPEVSIKLQKSATSRPVRGKLIRLSSFEAIVDTGSLSRRDRERGEVGQRVELKRIDELHSTDGRFEFTSEHDFEEITKRAKAAYTSVRTLDGNGGSGTPILGRELPGSSGSALPGSMEAEQARIKDGNAVAKTPPLGSTNKNSGLGKAGFGGLKNLPPTEKSGSAPEESSPEDSTADANTENATSNQLPGSQGSETFFCSNCTKVIPTTAFRTGVCPHCKTPFSNVSVAPSSNGAAGGSPGGGPSAFAPSTPNGGAFGPTGSGNAANAAQTGAANTGTVVVQGGGGFTFDSVPNWAKGGIFILFVLAAYHLLFNR